MSVKRASGSAKAGANRRLLSVLAVLGTVATGAPALAAPPVDSSARLPEGVHRTRAGRYLQDMCSHKKRIHCLGEWLLPEEWQPGMALPSHRADAAHPQAGGTCTGSAASGMSPTDVLTAYKVPATSASGGKIVALIDEQDGTAFGDVTGYRTGYKLPALPQCTTVPTGSGSPCFAQVDSETGDVIANPTSFDPDGDGETGLDMAMVSAACPDCSILLVAISEDSENNLTGDNTWQAWVDGVATAKKLGASAVSISFGGVEDTDPNVISLGESDDGGLDFTGGYTAPGMTVFVASGDFAYLNENTALDDAGTIFGASPSYPSSAPDVVSVGGTMLIRGTTAGTYTEAVWDDGQFGNGDQDVTTSGCSTEFAMPPWQATVLQGTSCTKRATADLAAAAAFGYKGKSVGINSCASGAFGLAEGTSAASPMVAGIFTRIGVTGVLSHDLGWIYASPTGFNDLGGTAYPVDTTNALGSDTDSADPTSCGKLCTAGPGWDGPSGMGTPNATALAALPQTLGEDAGPSASSSSSSSSGGSSSGPTLTEDAGTSSEPDAGSSGGFSSSGGSSGGCSVVTGDDDRGNLGLLAGTLGIAALFGVRRRRGK